MKTTKKNNQPKAAKVMFIVYTPYGNEVLRTPWEDVAIRTCDDKSIAIGGDCYVETIKGKLYYSSGMAFGM